MDAIIKVENVTKEYKTKHYTVKTLDNISLEIERGEICVLIGRSGSGKSTLMNVVGGLLIPDSGQVIIDREPLYADKRNKFGYLGGK